MNKKFIGVVLSLLVAAGCGTQADKAAAPTGETLAAFKGGVVTSDEFMKVAGHLPMRAQLMVSGQKKEFLESLVAEKLLLAEAEKRGFQHLVDVQELVRRARDQILIAKLLDEEVESKGKPTDEEIRKYYDEHGDEFMTPYRVKALHILVRSREEADKVLERLKGGEDFATVAKAVSLDPTAARGGDLGFFQRGQLIPEVEEAAFALTAGQMSEVVQSSFGFHILKVTEVAQPQREALDAVKAEIAEKLEAETKSRKFTELVDGLKSKSDVRYFDEKLKTLVLDVEKNASASIEAPASEDAPVAEEPAADPS